MNRKLNTVNRGDDPEYEIDLFEIYNYEVKLFREEKIKHEELQVVYYFIEEFFLKKKPEPFMEVSYEPDAPHRLYTDRYLREINQFIKGLGITFCFLNQDKLYDIEEKHICIFKNDVNSISFEKLFAYSLRTYEVKLSEIFPFLNFQLANNFENNSKEFHLFLEFVLTQHDILLSEKIVKIVRMWIQENSILIHQNSETTSNNNTSNIATLQDIQNNFEAALLEEIPFDYSVVDLRISRTNIINFFSFLYTTTDKIVSQ